MQVAERMGLSPKKVDFIAVQHEKQIRNNKGAFMEVQRELLLLAQEYGARAEIHYNVMREATEFVIEKFGFCGAKEIRAAYRAWASGEITPGEHAEMYGGSFNVRQLGAVLNAWAEYRRGVVADYIRTFDALAAACEQNEKNEKYAAKFDAEFPGLIDRAKTSLKSWDKVPEFWFEACVKRGWISLQKEQASEIFERAKKLEQEDRAKRPAVSIFERAIQNQEKILTNTQVIARKIAVWEIVLKKGRVEVLQIEKKALH